MNLKRTLESASGYLSLGMFDEALVELDSLPPGERDRPESLAVRVAVFMNRKEWEAAYRVSLRICTMLPESDEAFIGAAFCLHEMKRTAEARECLLQGPATLRERAIFHYNMACYECQLGNLDQARDHLKTSFKMNREFRSAAAQDTDLEALQAEMAEL